jgi:hypothetical protein
MSVAAKIAPPCEKKNGPTQQLLQVGTPDNNITPREFMALSNKHLVSVTVLEDADPTITHTHTHTHTLPINT